MVRMIVIYGRELERILINDNAELDISAIADRPIADWFEPLSERA